MAITLNDFKEGGALRRFITQVGLLEKIDTAAEEEQTNLLSKLISGVTNVGTYTDSNNDGIIDASDSIAPDYAGGDEPAPEPTEKETDLKSFTIVASERSWNKAYNEENSALRAYYEDHPEEDLWNTKENRAVNFSDRWYTGTIDSQEVSCGTVWVAAGVQKITVDGTDYYMEIWGYDLTPKNCELFTNAEMTESANKTFEIATVSFSEDCVHCWKGSVNAPGAAYPWLVISLPVPTTGKLKVECPKAGEGEKWPWGNEYKEFQRGYAICSLPTEFDNPDIKIDPDTGKATIKIISTDVTVTLYEEIVAAPSVLSE